MSKNATAGATGKKDGWKRVKLWGIPTTVNSIGMNRRKKWNSIFRTGHPSLFFISLQVRGERTSVSHAATVKVQTKKYLCALKWGGKLR